MQNFFKNPKVILPVIAAVLLTAAYAIASYNPSEKKNVDNMKQSAEMVEEGDNNSSFEEQVNMDLSAEEDVFESEFSDESEIILNSQQDIADTEEAYE